jgi:hypothetical protein
LTGFDLVVLAGWSFLDRGRSSPFALLGKAGQVAAVDR